MLLNIFRLNEIFLQQKKKVSAEIDIYKVHRSVLLKVNSSYDINCKLLN